MVDRTALREAFINAIVHNDYGREVPPVVELYADRVAITSYGGLVPGLSREEFFSGRSMIRNRELMRIFRDLDLVEQLGSGMTRILQKYPREIFRISEHFLEVCFPYAEGYMKDGHTHQVGFDQEPVYLTEKRRGSVGKTSHRILEICRSNPHITIREISSAAGITKRSVQRSLKKLKELGLIQRFGGRKIGSWRVNVD